MHALQVSHHIHCNDDAFDEDVVNAFPILRFDARQPRYWYHQYQHMCVASLRACLCVCVCVCMPIQPHLLVSAMLCS